MAFGPHGLLMEKVFLKLRHLPNCATNSTEVASGTSIVKLPLASVSATSLACTGALQVSQATPGMNGGGVPSGTNTTALYSGTLPPGSNTLPVTVVFWPAAHCTSVVVPASPTF